MKSSKKIPDLIDDELNLDQKQSSTLGATPQSKKSEQMNDTIYGLPKRLEFG